MRYEDPKLRSLLAGEYVLGTLRGAARRRLERLMEQDPGLREAVRSWESRLAGLAETVPEVAPPRSVWQNIEAQTEPAARSRAFLWHCLGFWRGLALVSTAVALALALYLGLRPAPELPPASVAVLADQAAQPRWVLTASRIDLSRGRIRVEVLGTAPLPQDKSFELWLLPKGAAKPIALGLLPPTGKITLTLPAGIVRSFEKANTLAVSLEPQGGSPTGQPTGPVLYSGKLLVL